MFLAAAIMLLGELSPGYADVPNYGVSKCPPVSEKLDRRSAQALDAHKTQAIYFRQTDWPCEVDANDEAGWYSSVLRALREPSFAFASSRLGFRERLRVLVLPHADPGYILRLDVRADGSALMTVSEAKWTSRKRQSEPRMVRSWAVRVDPEKAKKMVEDARLADVLRPRFQPDIEDQKPNPDDGSDQSICISFSRLILERLDEYGRHSVAKTGCGQSDAIDPVIFQIHRLAGVEVMTLEPVH